MQVTDFSKLGYTFKLVNARTCKKIKNTEKYRIENTETVCNTCARKS